MLSKCYFDLSLAEALGIPRGTLHGKTTEMDPAYMSVNGTDNINCPLKGMDCNGLLNFQSGVIRVH